LTKGRETFIREGKRKFQVHPGGGEKSFKGSKDRKALSPGKEGCAPGRSNWRKGDLLLRNKFFSKEGISKRW